MLLTEPRLHIWPKYFTGSETMEICAEDALNIKYNMVPTPLIFLTIWKGDNTWICLPVCTCTHVCMNERRGVWVLYGCGSAHMWMPTENIVCLALSISIWFSWEVFSLSLELGWQPGRHNVPDFSNHQNPEDVDMRASITGCLCGCRGF